ncbi:MAG: hypothetical protein DMD86_19550 [Candidatus Rokuibacteriota bacterium]|nr:MAG: hypothetical protein DMD86_19550 [Candidatus Rokubacteria bacterium]
MALTSMTSGLIAAYYLRLAAGGAVVLTALIIFALASLIRRAVVGALSTGQQQRVLIARALVSNPELLILDEPTGGVDPEAQTSFYALLQHLNRERDVTLILVSHDIGVVAKEVTKLACLNRRLIFHGRPGDFLTDAALTALYGPSVRVVSHQH